MPSSLGRYCFLHAGFPCCLSTNACADGQGSLSQAALPKAAMFDAVASVLRGTIAIYWYCDQRVLRGIIAIHWYCDQRALDAAGRRDCKFVWLARTFQSGGSCNTDGAAELPLMQTEGSIIQHPPDASVKQLLR